MGTHFWPRASYSLYLSTEMVGMVRMRAQCLLCLVLGRLTGRCRFLSMAGFWLWWDAAAAARLLESQGNFGQGECRAAPSGDEQEPAFLGAPLCVGRYCANGPRWAAVGGVQSRNINAPAPLLPMA